MTMRADHDLSATQRADVGPEERRAVLRAALVVAQQRGYHGTTVGRIAELAGVAPQVVTGAFPSRAALLCAALELAFEHYHDVAPTWSDEGTLPDLRPELGRRLVRGVGDGRSSDFWRLGLLMLLEPALADDDCGALFMNVRRSTKDALTDYWRRILPDDLAGDEHLVALAVRGHMSLVDGSHLAAHATPEWELERMLAFVARGVSALVQASSPEQGGSE